MKEEKEEDSKTKYNQLSFWLKKEQIIL
jgi:hypothetical protein